MEQWRNILKQCSFYFGITSYTSENDPEAFLLDIPLQSCRNIGLALDHVVLYHSFLYNTRVILTMKFVRGVSH